MAFSAEARHAVPVTQKKVRMMLQLLRILLILLSVMVGTSSLAPKAWALSKFDPPKTFTATASCDAVTSIRSGTGPVAVNKGQAFKALGTNKKNRMPPMYKLRSKGGRNGSPSHAVRWGARRHVWALQRKRRQARRKPLPAPPRARVGQRLVNRDFGRFLTISAIWKKSASAVRRI